MNLLPSLRVKFDGDTHSRRDRLEVEKKAAELPTAGSFFGRFH